MSFNDKDILSISLINMFLDIFSAGLMEAFTTFSECFAFIQMQFKNISLHF